MNYQFLQYHQIATPQQFSYVYKPHLDSYLFLDVLNQDLQSFKPQLVLQIGSGSGILITHIAKKLSQSYCLATDINPDACFLTKKYAQFHKINNIEIIMTDITKGLKGQFLFELIIINPPYVPTQEQQLQRHLGLLKSKIIKFKQSKSEYQFGLYGNAIDISYSGGLKGMHILKKMLRQGLKALSKHGRLYLFIIKENDLQSIVNIGKQYGRQYEIRCQKKRPGEHQMIILFR